MLAKRPAIRAAPSAIRRIEDSRAIVPIRGKSTAPGSASGCGVDCASSTNLANYRRLTFP
jgi:hypothetical protein